MGHFCAVPPGRMLFAIFEFVKGSFVVSFNPSYVSLLCGSWPHARIQKTVADESPRNRALALRRRLKGREQDSR